MKKILIITLVASASILGTANADQVPGALEFVGKVTNPSCYVRNQQMTIEMGIVAGTSFNGVGTTSGAKAFDIQLADCPVTVNQASVTFIGNSADQSNTILALTDSENSAKGIGIEILTANDSKVVTLDQPTPKQSLTPGENRLPFMARFIATTDVVVGGGCSRQRHVCRYL